MCSEAACNELRPSSAELGGTGAYSAAKSPNAAHTLCNKDEGTASPGTPALLSAASSSVARDRGMLCSARSGLGGVSVLHAAADTSCLP